MATRFGNLLAAARRARKLTQADVAEKSGIKPATIGHMEQGRGGVSTVWWKAVDVVGVPRATALRSMDPAMLKNAWNYLMDAGEDNPFEKELADMPPQPEAVEPGEYETYLAGLPPDLARILFEPISYDHVITPEQSRCARIMLGWSQTDLAQKAKVSIGTVRNFETRAYNGAEATLTALKAALERGGIAFLAPGETADGGYGLRERKIPS